MTSTGSTSDLGLLGVQDPGSLFAGPRAIITRLLQSLLSHACLGLRVSRGLGVLVSGCIRV